MINTTDTNENVLRYEIHHKITGEVKSFNQAMRALTFLDGPLNDGSWIGPIAEIRIVVLDFIY